MSHPWSLGRDSSPVVAAELLRFVLCSREENLWLQVVSGSHCTREMQSSGKGEGTSCLPGQELLRLCSPDCWGLTVLLVHREPGAGAQTPHRVLISVPQCPSVSQAAAGAQILH